MKPVHMASILLTMLLVLYPLSLGPVALCCSRIRPDAASLQKLETFYAPVIWVCAHNQTVGKAYEWYFQILGV